MSVLKLSLGRKYLLQLASKKRITEVLLMFALNVKQYLSKPRHATTETRTMDTCTWRSDQLPGGE